jgi:hypothetical protein
MTYVGVSPILGAAQCGEAKGSGRDRQSFGETAQQRNVSQALDAALVAGDLRAGVSAALAEFSQRKACCQASSADNGARMRAWPLVGRGPHGFPRLVRSHCLLRTSIPV